MFAEHAASPCQLQGLPGQDWNRSHTSWDNGRNDGFVRASGPIAMRFWDQSDLRFTYSLVKHFPIGERFFCSTLCQTYPNRRFFFTGTASGTIATDGTTFSVPAANGTLFDRLDAHKIDWAVYYRNVGSFLIDPNVLKPPGRAARYRHYSQFLSDAATGRLPKFTFLDPQYDTSSEENPQDIQVGERFIAQVVQGADARADVEANGAVHHLRRARRLLRPRSPSVGDQARLDRAADQARRRSRQL